MNQFDYYFNHKKKEKQFCYLLNSSLFQQIIDFFIENQNERIILRQLKKRIKTDGNLELFLDKMIEFKLISRLDRHYSLSFPIYDLNDYQLTFSKELMSSLESIKQENKDYFVGFFGEILWLECETNEEYFFGVKRESNTNSFYEKRKIGDSELEMVAIQNRLDTFLTIPTYFELLSENKLPTFYKQLESLLGDVNQDYFFTQVKSIFKKAQKKKKRSSRKNIFEESLLLTNDLNCIDDALSLANPVLKRSCLKINDQNSKQIIKLLRELWSNYESPNKKVFIKKLVYLNLMRQLNDEKEEMAYFLI